MLDFRNKKSLEIESKKKKKKRIEEEKSRDEGTVAKNESGDKASATVSHPIISLLSNRRSFLWSLQLVLLPYRQVQVRFIPPLLFFSNLVPQQSNGAKFVISLLNFLFMPYKIDI